MAEAGDQLQKLTECCICLKEFTEPRMLPCIHTFCLGCLKQLQDETVYIFWPTRNKIKCPLCRKVFTIPSGGLDELQKNFFMESLMGITQNLQLFNMSSIGCDICKCLYEGDEQTKTATMRCLDCRDNFCDLCAKAHTLHKSSISHHIVKIGSETDQDMRRITPARCCNLHNQKPMDYYCPKCRNIFCVSCVLENHATHGCKDVNTVEDKFRKVIEENALKVSTYANEILPKSDCVEKNKEDTLTLLAKTESKIRQRQLELKEMIDKDATTLLDELSLMKQNHVKDCESEKEVIERKYTILKSFETYCTELASKGSASDICCCIDNLNLRASDLEGDHEEFIGRPSQTIKVSFAAGSTYNGNIVGHLEESFLEIENCVVIAGLYDNMKITNDFLKVNLQRPQVTVNQRQIPAIIQNGTCAAVYNNTLYVTGHGNNSGVIWKYCSESGWMKCALLVEGRSGHCMGFIDEMLYICGGYDIVNAGGSVLDSVEAYNAVSNTCQIVGKLVHHVQNSGNCVPYRNFLYIFGGTDDYNNTLNYVQMYDTKQNVCTLISKPMPSSQSLMRAMLCNTSVILIGCYTCYVFDLETETWAERKQFKTDVHYFGLAVENGRIFVIGGGVPKIASETGKQTWTLKDDIKYMPLQSFIDGKPAEWKLYSKLKSPGMVLAYAKVAHHRPSQRFCLLRSMDDLYDFT